ncbi:uncharacterized protein Hap1MRO34_004285 [Clarias gariepinus]
MDQESKPLAFHQILCGQTLNFHQEFLKRLRQRLQLTETSSVDHCDFIIAFVPLVSRAGTDIQAALQKIPTGKPVVLVALHFTFDENYVAPESRWNVNRDDVLAVDVLCYEDKGLLRCLRNDQALKTVTDHLISIGGSPSFEPFETPRPQKSWGYLSFIILIFFIFLITIAIAVAASIYVRTWENHIASTKPPYTTNITANNTSN